MPDTIAVLVVALLLMLSLSPFANKAYARCYYPIFRPPYSEAPHNLLVLLAISLGFIFLYAVISGGLTVLFTGPLPSTEALRSGAILGAFVFAAGRIWALTHSHSFAQSLYFTGILATSALLAVGLMAPDSWTAVTDEVLKRDIDDLSLLPVMFGFAVAVPLVSEGAVWLHDRFGSGAPGVSFAPEHFFRLLGSPSSAAIVGKALLRIPPDFEDRLDRAPGSFHHVLSGVERPIAHDGVDQQGFVSGWLACSKTAAVVEIHGNAAQLHALAGFFGIKTNGDAPRGLDPKDEQVRRLNRVLSGEQCMVIV